MREQKLTLPAPASNPQGHGPSAQRLVAASPREEFAATPAPRGSMTARPEAAQNTGLETCAGKNIVPAGRWGRPKSTRLRALREIAIERQAESLDDRGNPIDLLRAQFLPPLAWLVARVAGDGIQVAVGRHGGGREMRINPLGIADPKRIEQAAERDTGILAEQFVPDEDPFRVMRE